MNYSENIPDLSYYFPTIKTIHLNNHHYMKKIFISTILIIPALFLSAQKEYIPNTADLEKFFKTKTLVVLEDSPMSEFNFEIQDVMTREWKITPFEYIKNSDFKEKSKDENSSFLYTSIVNFEKDKTESRYIFLHLSLGGDNITIDDLRDMVSIPLGYYGVDPDNYIYKLGILIRFMQNHINLIYKDPGLISNNIFKHYNDNTKSAHDKVLYLIEDELTKDVSTAARIKQVYQYKFKLVTREEIKQAIQDGNNDVVFLHKVGPEGKKKDARCYKIIIGAGDAVFYYFDYHKVSDKNPDGFLKSDFSNLNK